MKMVAHDREAEELNGVAGREFQQSLFESGFTVIEVPAACSVDAAEPAASHATRD